MKKKLLYLISICTLILVLDQVIKIYVHTNFNLHESKTIIDGFFSFTYVRNPGAAFGMLRNTPELFRRVFFLSVTPIAIVVLFYFLATIKPQDIFQIIAISLIFSGALGNYIDRVRFEYVIDFLDFYIGNIHYPAFNVADIAIVCGVFLWFYCILNEDMKKAKA